MTPTLHDALRALVDRDRIIGFLAQGLRAIPAASRPVVPSWIADSAETKRADAMRARVADLARGAPAAPTAHQQDLPWAA